MTVASEPVTLNHAAFTDEEGRCVVCGGPDGHALECELQGVFASYDAVTAERDRLWKAIEEIMRSHGTGRALAYGALLATNITPPTGHTHPRPCSICRREDCTVIHECE
jgi:hypothetical protein